MTPKFPEVGEELLQNMTPAIKAGITIQNSDDYGGWSDWETYIQNAAAYAATIAQK